MKMMNVMNALILLLSLSALIILGFFVQMSIDYHNRPPLEVISVE